MWKKFLLLMLIMFATGCGTQGEKFVIGVDDEFPPMCFHGEHGELVGVDVDLAREAAKRLGVEFEFRPIDWDNKRDEIVSGNVDMIWNGLDITDERKEYMTFSKPYMNDRQILLVHSGNPNSIHAAGDLTGKVVGTQAGSSSETYINDIPKFKDSFAEFKTYRNFQDAFAELEVGDVDVLICNEIAARYEMTRNPGKMKLIETTIGPICEMGIGFRKDNVELRDRVQAVFDEMIADGTAKKISERWFQADLIKRTR